MSLPDRIASWDVMTQPDLPGPAEDSLLDALSASPAGPLVARLVPALGGEAVDLHQRTGAVTLGRSRELPVECRVAGARVSARHCEVRVDADTGRVALRDLSTNGTFLNGRRLAAESVELQPGDRIALSNPAGNTAQIESEAEAEAETGNGNGNGNAYEFLFQRVRSVASADDLADELTCSVCRCLYVRPCSALPCMHVFCASCISRWLRDGHTTCIECRGPLREVRPTHKIQSCVDQLLRANAALRRAPEELAECAAADDIPPEGRKIRKRRRRAGSGSNSDDSDYNNNSEEEDNDNDDDDDDDGSGSGSGGEDAGAPPPYARGHFGHAVPRTVGRTVRGTGGTVAVGAHCRHCAAPSPSDGFRCAAGGAHLTCVECRAPFPLRPLCPRPQRCQLCGAPHCALYYEGEGGCPTGGTGGTGGIARLRDYRPLGDEMPPRAFGGNLVEQRILSRHLAARGIAIYTVWQECAARLEAREWQPDVACADGEIGLDTALCNGCTETVFAALLFHYRRSVPNEQLPESVTQRANCWYGINCRTQFHKTHHACNFNHVCYEEKRKE